jgi:hypothetical protein
MFVSQRGESHGKTAYFAYCNSELRQLDGRAACKDCGACRSAASATNCNSYTYTSGADDCTQRDYSHGASSDGKH